MKDSNTSLLSQDFLGKKKIIKICTEKDLKGRYNLIVKNYQREIKEFGAVIFLTWLEKELGIQPGQLKLRSLRAAIYRFKKLQIEPALKKQGSSEDEKKSEDLGFE